MNYDLPPRDGMPDGLDAPEGAPAHAGPPLLIIGVALFVLGLIIITAATFQHDLVKNHVFFARQYDYVAALGYISAVGGLLLALVHFIKEG